MDECLVFASFSLMWIVNDKPLSGMAVPWRTQLMISMTSMCVGFFDYCEKFVVLSSVTYPFSHQSVPEQSVRSRIDGRHFGV
jgi:hypothetical protein